MKNTLSRFILLPLLLGLLFSACQPKAATPQNALFHGDPARSGKLDTRPLESVSAVKWQFETGGEVWSSPILAGGLVFFGSDDNTFYAVDAATGQLKWSYPTGDDVRTAAVVQDGIVYFTSFDGYIYALKTANGEEVWKLDLQDGVAVVRQRYDDYTSSPLVANGVVYVGTLNPRQSLVALDALTGALKWAYRIKPIPDLVHAIPALADGVLYFGTGGDLRAVDAASGTEKWVFATPGGSNNYAPAVADGVVYFASKDTHFYALDAGSGELKWKSKVAGSSWVTCSPALGEGWVYASTSDGHKIYALDRASGEVQWLFQTGNWVWSSPLLVGNFVYVGSYDGKVYALDAVSGEEQWHFETGGPIPGSPLVWDGILYVGSADGSLYALE